VLPRRQLCRQRTSCWHCAVEAGPCSCWVGDWSAGAPACLRRLQGEARTTRYRS
jgi:hypothetical protein